MSGSRYRITDNIMTSYLDHISYRDNFYWQVWTLNYYGLGLEEEGVQIYTQACCTQLW